MIFFAERVLRRAVNSFLEHYPGERAQQGIGNVTSAHDDVGSGEVQCDERLGGLLEHYRRAA